MFSETSMIKDYKDTMSFNCKRARVWEVTLTFQTKQNTHTRLTSLELGLTV